MKARKKLNNKRMRRVVRVAARMTGTAVRPRLVVNRSNRYISAQLVDDLAGRTIAAISNVGQKTAAKTTKSMQAFALGEALAKKAVEKGIKTAVFDRRSAKFHGRVKQLAEGAKKGGLKI